MTEKQKHQFYHSAAWLEKRQQILIRDHYECQQCRHRIEEANRNGVQLVGDDRRIRRAECVHHIKHYEDWPSLGLEDDNLISLCNTCHNLAHGRTVERFQKKAAREPVTPERW
jgi:5-methylcytosine-specific restriction endonuclease McrA